MEENSYGRKGKGTLLLVYNQRRITLALTVREKRIRVVLSVPSPMTVGRSRRVTRLSTGMKGGRRRTREWNYYTEAGEVR